MATIQIRGVPDDDHQTLREAAEAEGKSLQAYMLEQTSLLARRARKRVAIEAVREEWARSGGRLTREQILADLRALRGAG